MFILSNVSLQTLSICCGMATYVNFVIFMITIFIFLELNKDQNLNTTRTSTIGSLFAVHKDVSEFLWLNFVVMFYRHEGLESHWLYKYRHVR